MSHRDNLSALPAFFKTHLSVIFFIQNLVYNQKSEFELRPTIAADKIIP